MLNWTNALWFGMCFGGFGLTLFCALANTPPKSERGLRVAVLGMFLGAALLLWGMNELMSDFERRHPPNKVSHRMIHGDPHGRRFLF